MYTNYYWYADMPSKEELNFDDTPSDFFASLLSDKDGVIYNQKKVVFSSIKQETSSTKAIAGTNTYGFNFATYKNQAGKYYAWILYVLPGSPAAKAGIKRGDWIIGNKSSYPNITSTNTFLSGSATSFTIANYVNGAFITRDSVSIEASRVCESSPLLKDTVYSVGGKKVGYLMYCAFSSGPNDNSDETYNEELKNVFKKFKSKNVTELILDLRYNGGGLMSCAQLLGSMIAPSSALGKTFCKYSYSDKMTKSNKTINFLESSKISAYNLNLKRMVIITGSGTASASEAIINCLSAYVGRSNVYLVGQKTIGKPMGTVSYGEDKGYGWIINPVCFKIYNKDDVSDYDDGFTPDIKISELDKNIGLLPLGSSDDPLIKEGINWITGNSSTQSKSSQPDGLSFEGYIFSDTQAKELIIDYKVQ
jgi:C-terminal processing protease CtpA/Prc